jgi:hypothetical protein
MAKFNATGVNAFVAWIASIVVFIVFLLWAFSPKYLLHGIGITYYPSRYYAIALPAYIIITVFLIVIGKYVGMYVVMYVCINDDMLCFLSFSSCNFH